MDHPPLVALLAWLVTALFGNSLVALRVVPALCHAATVLVVARLAAELGGGRFARFAAGVGMALLPIGLSLASIYSMNALDLLFWALLWLLAARLLSGGDPRLWLPFGAVAGIGLENKLSVLFLGFAIVLGLVLAGRLGAFRSRWIWLGAGLAALLFAPHLLWQVRHDWPTLEFMDNARRLKMVALSPLGFLREATLGTGFSALLWIPGLAWLLAGPSRGARRPLGIAFLAVLVLLVVTHGKPYYLAAGYAAPLAAGAVAWERRTAGRRVAPRVALAAILIAGNAGLAPLAKPLLSEDGYVRYAAALGLRPGTDERHALARLPQFFADMHGWRRLAEDVAAVYRSLPPREREQACIFGQNYGEAGAVDFFGPELGLPEAISAHNSYWLWGPRGCTGAVVIVIGDERSRLAQLFGSVEPGARHDCLDCMPYENHLPIWIARRARRPIAALWPEIKSFI